MKIKKLLPPVFEEHKKVYGPTRMSCILRKMGYGIGRTRTGRLMNECGLRQVAHRPFVITTVAGKEPPALPDLVNREFSADAPNRIWTADITYIWTLKGFVYLAVILDVFSRYIVGWSLRKDQTAVLVLSAFSMALKRRGVPKEFVFHTDKGGQFFSTNLRAQLSLLEIKQSMGSTGDCFDNAVTESFNATLKKECIYLEPIGDYDQAYRKVFDYIEMFYNPIRLHSYLGYQSPAEYEINQKT